MCCDWSLAERPLKIRRKIIKLDFVGNKGESQNGCFKNLPKNEHFLPPDTQGVRNVRFSENLVCFVFLKHPF